MGFDRNKFEKRVQKEFKTKLLVGDIYVNEIEYGYLIEYFKNNCDILQYDANIKPDRIFSLALVQIGIHDYDGNYWEHLDKIVGYPIVGEHRKRISELFYKTLYIYEKSIINKSGFVKNVLMHGFVSNHYCKNLFDFLYKFYSIDIERNLKWESFGDALNILIDSIKEESHLDENNTTNREYMLVKQTIQAMRSLSKNSIRMRFKWLLKYLDAITFNEEVKSNSKSRLINQMINWSKTSQSKARIDKEYKNQNNGSYRNEIPYIKYKESNDTFTLYIPSQRHIIRRNNDLKIFLNIGDERKELPIGLNEFSTIIKTMDYKVGIKYEDLFKNMSIDVYVSEKCIKVQILTGSRIVFFNQEFISNKINDNKQSVHLGVNNALTNNETRVSSSMSTDYIRFHGGRLYTFNFSTSDYLFVDSTQLYSPSQKYIEGINNSHKIDFIKCNNLNIYNKVPIIFIKSQKEKLSGLKYVVNENVHRRDESIIMLDSIEISNPEIQAVLNLENNKNIKIGENKILIDFPGLKAREYSFIYLPDLKFEFVNEPFIFTSEGYIDFLGNKNINSQNESKNGLYKFEINNQENYEFFYNIDSQELKLNVEPPIFEIIDINEELIEMKPFGDQWHKSFNYSKILRYYNYYEVILNKNNNMKIKPERDSNGYFKCDLSKLKSWFYEIDDTSCIVNIEIGNKYYELARVFLRTEILGFSSLEFNEDKKVIEAEFEKIGDDNLYLSIKNLNSDFAICEKSEQVSNKISIKSEGEAGIYEIEFFIKSNGFSKNFVSIYKIKRELKTNNFVGIKFKLVSHYFDNIRFQVHKYAELTSLRIERKISDNEYIAELFISIYNENAKKFINENLCKVLIRIIDFNKYYRSEIMLLDEDEDDPLPLLYDKHIKRLVIDEDHTLDSKTRYSRYSFLDEVTFDLEIGA